MINTDPPRRTRRISWNLALLAAVVPEEDDNWEVDVLSPMIADDHSRMSTRPRLATTSITNPVPRSLRNSPAVAAPLASSPLALLGGDWRVTK